MHRNILPRRALCGPPQSDVQVTTAWFLIPLFCHRVFRVLGDKGALRSLNTFSLGLPPGRHGRAHSRVAWIYTVLYSHRQQSLQVSRSWLSQRPSLYLILDIVSEYLDNETPGSR